jgi:hypothetical protein
LQNPELVKAADDSAKKRAAFIAGAAGLGGAIAGRSVGAATGARQATRAAARELGQQAALDTVGELGGQYVGGQRISPKEVLEEVVGGAGQNVVEVASGALSDLSQRGQQPPPVKLPFVPETPEQAAESRKQAIEAVKRNDEAAAASRYLFELGQRKRQEQQSAADRQQRMADAQARLQSWRESGTTEPYVPQTPEELELAQAEIQQRQADAEAQRQQRVRQFVSSLVSGEDVVSPALAEPVAPVERGAVRQDIEGGRVSFNRPAEAGGVMEAPAEPAPAPAYTVRDLRGTRPANAPAEEIVMQMPMRPRQQPAPTLAPQPQQTAPQFVGVQESVRGVTPDIELWNIPLPEGGMTTVSRETAIQRGYELPPARVAQGPQQVAAEVVAPAAAPEQQFKLVEVPGQQDYDIETGAGRVTVRPTISRNPQGKSVVSEIFVIRNPGLLENTLGGARADSIELTTPIIADTPQQAAKAATQELVALLNRQAKEQASPQPAPAAPVVEQAAPAPSNWKADAPKLASDNGVTVKMEFADGKSEVRRLSGKSAEVAVRKQIGAVDTLSALLRCSTGG